MFGVSVLALPQMGDRRLTLWYVLTYIYSDGHPINGGIPPPNTGTTHWLRLAFITYDILQGILNTGYIILTYY